jgi:hypothetical protein
MEDIIANIKAYVLTIDSTLTDDDYLDFLVAETVDRVLSYTNRQQLVRDYEEDVVDYEIDDKTDEDETYYTFWKYYDNYPIPAEIERAIAKVVIDNYKTTLNKIESTGGAITSVEDNGQKVSYGDKVQNYYSSESDNDVFSSIKTMLDKYRLPNIVSNTIRRYHDNT